MLSKLMKHEFRATARTMLPIYAAVAALTILANLSLRLMGTLRSSSYQNTLLILLLGLVVFAFAVSIIAVSMITVLMMLQRFNRNLLKNEGYLMHTLPATVHEHVWSKLLVSLAWFVATALVIALAIFLTALLQSGTDLGEVFSQLPALWDEIRQALLGEGVRPGQLARLGLQLLAGVLLASLVLCLHFYAAMALGHMFSKNKVALSVVFFLLINLLLQILDNGLTVLLIRLRYPEGIRMDIQTVTESLRLAKGLFNWRFLVQLARGALLYLLTVLGLKRGLNLE